LTQSALEPVVASAKAQWLVANPGASFDGVTVTVGDLPDLQLGFTDGKSITIDASAAGWGWSVSGGGMDLATVVLHELGHALGLDHDDGVMADTLSAGETRRLPLVARAPLLQFASVPSIRPQRPARTESARATTIRSAAALRTLHPRRISHAAPHARS